MSKNKYKDKKKIGDYQIFCQQCGQVCWASHSQKLSGTTGNDGLIVCPNCVDKTDWGLVPYTIRSSRPLPVSSINQTSTQTGLSLIDLDVTDPMSINRPT